jgi:hypothetical protein
MHLASAGPRLFTGPWSNPLCGAAGVSAVRQIATFAHYHTADTAWHPDDESRLGWPLRNLLEGLGLVKGGLIPASWVGQFGPLGRSRSSLGRRSGVSDQGVFLPSPVS